MTNTSDTNDRVLPSSFMDQFDKAREEVALLQSLFPHAARWEEFPTNEQRRAAADPARTHRGDGGRG